jgi:hypothetical protein
MSDLQQRLSEKIKDLEAELSSLREEKESYDRGIGLGLNLNGKPLKAATDTELAEAILRLTVSLKGTDDLTFRASEQTLKLLKEVTENVKILCNAAYSLLESRQCAAKITSINALLAKARSLMSQDSKVADFLKDLE